MGQKRFARAAAVLALLTLGAAGGWASAQSIAPRAVNPPRILMGEDVGFRIEAQRGNTVVGRVVVRLNGEWVETESAGGSFRLGHGSN
jgi:hypothetical protein